MSNITIISSAPSNNATAVLLDTYIEIYTSAQLKSQTVTSTNVNILDAGNAPLVGTLTYSNHDNGVYGIIGFSPDAVLKPLQTYTITINGLVGTAEEELAGPITIMFTAGEILTQSLITPDKISFFEKKCYPVDGSNILSWSEYAGNGIISSRRIERYISAYISQIVDPDIPNSVSVWDIGIREFLPTEFFTANGLFILGGRTPDGLYYFTTSTDGITWSKGVVAEWAHMGAEFDSSLIYNNGTYYYYWNSWSDALSKRVLQVATSADGKTWTSVSIASISEDLTNPRVATNGTVYIMAGYMDGKIYTYYSTDGIAWSLDNSMSLKLQNSITWTGSKFILVGFDYALQCIFTSVSTDGIVWSSSESIIYEGSTVNITLYDTRPTIMYDGNNYVIIGRTSYLGGTTILSTTDFINWNKYTTDTSIYSIGHIRDDNKFIVYIRTQDVFDNIFEGTIISTDGINWTLAISQEPTTTIESALEIPLFNGTAYVGKQWIFAQSMQVSDDGLIWTPGYTFPGDYLDTDE